MLKIFGPECYFIGKKKELYEIHKIPFVVGRGATADLVLTSPQISRSHCIFSQSDQKMWLLECHSMDGLRVDGEKLKFGEKKVLTGESLIALTEDVIIIFFPQFQDLSNQSTEIVDVPKINTTISLDEKLKPKLDLSKDRFSKAIADIERIRAENIKILQMRLGEKEKKVSEAELRKATLERRCENLDQKLKTMSTLHAEELTKAQAETAIMTVKAADKEQDCEKRLREAEKRVLAATAEAAEYKASLHEKEVENRNLQAMSSNLSDDVAKYERYWMNSVINKAALTKKIAALEEKTTKLPELTDNQLNDVKEAARLDQVHEFEEFIETDLQCAICFELVIAATALNCGHTFCSKCVGDWQARSANCPTCRVQIVTMQRCKMLDSFIARAAVKLSEDFRVRRSEATSGHGADSQGQPQ